MSTRVCIKIVSEQRTVEELWVPWEESELEEIGIFLGKGKPCCFSDASVSGEKKALVVWFGTENRKGKMLTYEVVGLQHDSGRGELAGPVLALRVLYWLQNKIGFVSDMEMKIDNMEVINICGKMR